MNRKESIVVGLLLLSSFVGGAFAAPAAQQVFVTNFPSNQQVTVSNRNLNVTVTNPTRTLQTTAVDIPLSDTQIQIWNFPSQTSSPGLNLTRAFAFAPSNRFVQVTSLALAVTYSNLGTYTGSPPASTPLIIGVNSQFQTTLPLTFFNSPSTTESGPIGTQGIHPGANILSIGLPPNYAVVLIQVHIIIEYTYLA